MLKYHFEGQKLYSKLVFKNLHILTTTNLINTIIFGRKRNVLKNKLQKPVIQR